MFDIVISRVRSTHVLAAPAFRIVARSERVGVRIKYPYRKSGLRNCIATNRVATAAAAALYSRAPGERAVSLSSMSDANILVYSARAISPARRRESRRRMQFSLLREQLSHVASVDARIFCPPDISVRWFDEKEIESGTSQAEANLIGSIVMMLLINVIWQSQRETLHPTQWDIAVSSWEDDRFLRISFSKWRLNRKK